DNNVIQNILPLNTCICKIKEYTADDYNQSIKQAIEESKNAIDINDELIKITLIHYNEQSYIIFVIHHLIIDGVSWNILLDDLTYIYTQMLSGDEINLLRPYPYNLWVEDVKKLSENISDNEKQHWREINNLLDDSKIKGQSKNFAFNVNASFKRDNLLMLSEEEYLALS
ncbi:condensation domain-containing protein, partial [Methanobrevibacter sp.]